MKGILLGHLVTPRMPTLNEMLIAKRRTFKGGHHDGYSVMKRKTEDLVKLSILESGIKPVVGPVQMVFVWTMKSRRVDPDNILAGRKFILDALVSGGILKGDGWSAYGSCEMPFVDIFRIGRSESVRVYICKLQEGSEA